MLSKVSTQMLIALLVVAAGTANAAVCKYTTVPVKLGEFSAPMGLNVQSDVDGVYQVTGVKFVEYDGTVLSLSANIGTLVGITNRTLSVDFTEGQQIGYEEVAVSQNPVQHAAQVADKGSATVHSGTDTVSSAYALTALVPCMTLGWTLQTGRSITQAACLLATSSLASNAQDVCPSYRVDFEVLVPRTVEPWRSEIVSSIQLLVDYNAKMTCIKGYRFQFEKGMCVLYP